MTTLNYSININATPHKVWETLWSDATYGKWTSAFMEGSTVETNWEEGSRIAFLDPDNNGMFGIIEKKVVDSEMIFRHLGEIRNAVEENKHWENATEGYKLIETKEGTVLEILLTMDGDDDEYKDYFNEAFPKALGILKELCER